MPTPRPRAGTRKLVIATSLGLALGAVGFAATAPERVLEAEFARQRWLAKAGVTEVEVAGHRWAVLESGRDSRKPLLVFVHGFTGSKENWLPLMRELAKDHRIIAPDLPGWGDSERLHDADYGPVAQAERLAQFIRALPERPALVVGHSMGGQIVGLMSARHPDLADRISLMSSAGVRYEENAFANAVLAGENPFQVTTRAELKRYLGIVFADPPFVPWPANEAMVRRRRADAGFEQRVLDGIGRGPDAFALEAELANIRAHTLLLWCRDDRVIDVSAAEVFHRGLSSSRTVILAGCGHMPMMAQPRQVADAIGRFMDGPG
ncbi:MAG TPA: alpha/beta fold hydrolase [Arenimonas sp.]|uniref:alpha/beta fold hydrolase n=1 Tax=Arenimonas sp. TaxID=1872635 RepID=UPI002D7F1190|nr:alpha/beta fold hydrolase [Arenimonas sp.]HEU0152699.1 alpha/beta fold hydrolase [Arenimonas sp.]